MFDPLLGRPHLPGADNISEIQTVKVTLIFRKKNPNIGIPIAWYKARIPVLPRKSMREGASSLFGPGEQLIAGTNFGQIWGFRRFWTP